MDMTLHAKNYQNRVKGFLSVDTPNICKKLSLILVVRPVLVHTYKTANIVVVRMMALLCSSHNKLCYAPHDTFSNAILITVMLG